MRHGRNIRALNLVEDPDGVIRRIPLFLTAEGTAGQSRQEPSMALELAARALDVQGPSSFRRLLVEAALAGSEDAR